MTITGDGSTVVSDALRRLGFTCKTNRAGATTRIVGYSMTGGTIPVGETEICAMSAGHTRITQVVLSDANADAITAAIEGVTSGIESLTPSLRGEGSIYTLGGQRITSPKKGIYINNGTKIVNK